MQFENKSTRQQHGSALENAMQVIIVALDSGQPTSATAFQENFAAAQAILLAMAVSLLKRFSVTNPKFEAEDAVQAWHQKMLRGGFASYCRERGPFVPFAHRALKNICIDIAKARKSIALSEEHGGDRRNPHKRVIDEESKRIIHAALGRLPAGQRQVIERRFKDGKKLREIAIDYKTNPSTVAVRIHRGLKRLYDDLDRCRGNVWPCEQP